MRKLMLLAFIMAYIIPCKATQPNTDRYPGGKGWQPGAKQYGYEILRDIFIQLDDSIRLEAEVAYPTDTLTGSKANGKFPVLVEFTPYKRADQERLRHTYLVEHGYIVAQVHPRGSGSSTGVLEQFTSRDGLDGVKVVEWASHLDGSNGKVGFFGSSYPAALALATAAKVGKNSPLKAVLAASIGLGAQYRQAWTNNGLPTFLMMGYGSHAAEVMGGNKGAETYFKEFERSFWAGETPAYDGEYWEDRLPLSWAKDIVDNGIPVLSWGGWQDLNETGALRGYVAFQNEVAGRDIYLPMEEGQKTSPCYQQIMGDWGHAIGMDIGVYLEWFDTWLKGSDTGLAETDTPLHLFEVGTQRWVNLSVFPSVKRYVTWKLGNEVITQGDVPKGEIKLAWGKPTEHNGMVVFDSEPITEGLIISGSASLQLYAKSSNTNMEILARLYDVTSDNHVTQISKGAMLGSMSKLNELMSWRDENGVSRWPWPCLDRDIYLIPDSVQLFEMALKPIQYGLQPGHRLRLVLSTQSLGPVTEGRMPSEGNRGFLIAEPGELTAPQKATLPGGCYTLFVGADNPTSLSIPQLPYNHFSTVEAQHNSTSWNESTRDFDRTGYTIPIDW